MGTYIGQLKIDTGDVAPIGSTLYGTCDTAAATAAKVATVTGFNKLITGVTVHIKFTYSNTVANPTLAIKPSSSGTATTAKSIMKYGTTAPGTSAATSWQAGSIISLTYDGTYWQMNDHLDDTNTQTVTGVKGNSESTYRTGNVNITPANIGAAAASTMAYYAPASTLSNYVSVKNSSTLSNNVVITAGVGSGFESCDVISDDDCTRWAYLSNGDMNISYYPDPNNSVAVYGTRMRGEKIVMDYSTISASYIAATTYSAYGVASTVGHPSGWNQSRDNALIKSHGYANNGSLYPAVSMLAVNGSWCMGVIGNNNRLYFSWTRNNEYTQSINKTDQYYIEPVNDGNAHEYKLIHSGNIAAGAYRGVYTLTAAGTLNWGTNNDYVLDKGAIAYWNGAYSGTGSNLTYCSKGTIVGTNNIVNGTVGSAATNPSVIYSRIPSIGGNPGVMDIGQYIDFHLPNSNVDYSTRIYANSNGGLSCSGAFSPGSSRKIKKNIEDIPQEEADKILSLRPVKFDYKSSPKDDQEETGFIAEEVYEVYPKLTVPEEGEEESSFFNPMGLKYEEIIPYLVKVCQRQQNEIDDLKTQIEELRNLIVQK